MSEKKKDPGAVRLGRKGGRAGKGAAKTRSREQAQKAARARWGKKASPANRSFRQGVGLGLGVGISLGGVGFALGIATSLGGAGGSPVAPISLGIGPSRIPKPLAGCRLSKYSREGIRCPIKKVRD